jgi:hypothetical protein
MLMGKPFEGVIIIQKLNAAVIFGSFTQAITSFFVN